MGERENSCFVSPIEQTSRKWQFAVFSFKEDVDTGRNAGTSTREEEAAEEAEVVAAVAIIVEEAVVITVEAHLSLTGVVEVWYAVKFYKDYRAVIHHCSYRHCLNATSR